MTTPAPPTLADIEAALETLTPDEVLALRALLPDDGTEGDWSHDDTPPGGLGRLETWDPRSDAPRATVMRALAATGVPSSVLWDRNIKPLDQGRVGACTGFAIGGLVMSEPVAAPGVSVRTKQCFNIYSRATTLDPFRGTYPPDDTGSDGNSAAKAARDLGYIGSWVNGRSADDLNALLQLGPVAVGVPWYSSFNEPDSWGTIHLAASARVIGGHEFAVMGVNIEQDMYRAANSWGTSWGDSGYFNIPGPIVRRWYVEGADCTQVYR